MTKRDAIAIKALRCCTAYRRKYPYLRFFLDDPPCGDCVRWAKEKARKETK